MNILVVGVMNMLFIGLFLCEQFIKDLCYSLPCDLILSKPYIIYGIVINI